MFALTDLTRPLVAAPMAGGPSTPALVSAVGRAGGLGFLGAGYKSVESMRAEMDAVRSCGVDTFGVNVFVPDPPADLAAAQAYRERLLPLAESLVVELPTPHQHDDHYDEKCDALVAAAVPVVSFTFGCPSPQLLARMRSAGMSVWVTVTSANEARQATEAGATALVVQGPNAGGHRGSFDPLVTPPTQSLDELLQAVRAAVNLPLIAAGGIGAPEQVAGALKLANAVQLGTALLDSDEAGTNPVHRQALHDARFTTTALTRAFSGRYARGLRNSFIDDYSETAPAAYPAVNQLTAPIRQAAAAAGDPELLALWAGTSWRTTRSGPAAEILAVLYPH